jgi:hypothetical protein
MNEQVAAPRIGGWLLLPLAWLIMTLLTTALVMAMSADRHGGQQGDGPVREKGAAMGEECRAPFRIKQRSQDRNYRYE